MSGPTKTMTGWLAGKIQQALGMLTELNRLIEDVIGPSGVTAAGELLALPETEPPKAGAVVGIPVDIAGGGFEHRLGHELASTQCALRSPGSDCP
jgi:hypothetical protein